MAKIIEVTIDDQGNTTMDIQGCSDNSCDKIVQDFKTLGNIVDHKKKPEYNNRNQNRQTNRK